MSVRTVYLTAKPAAIQAFLVKHFPEWGEWSTDRQERPAAWFTIFARQALLPRRQVEVGRDVFGRPIYDYPVKRSAVLDAARRLVGMANADVAHLYLIAIDTSDPDAAVVAEDLRTTFTQAREDKDHSTVPLAFPDYFVDPTAPVTHFATKRPRR